MIRILLVFVLLLAPACHQRLSLDQQVEQARMFERLITKAVELMRKNNSGALREAEATLNLAQELRPGDPRVLDGFGAVAYRRNRLTEARDYFRRSCEPLGAYARGCAHWALTEQRLGNYAKARELFELAVRQAPLDVRIRTNFGAALLVNGELAEAREQTLRALQLSAEPDLVAEHNLNVLGGRDP